MPNLVYYKDSNGVVSGPLKEEEAIALYKANFFRPDHVFRVVDANNSEQFSSIDDLRTLNGAENPFGQRGDEKEQKELLRVYKELEKSLRDRVEMATKVKDLEDQLKKMNCLEEENKILREKENRREIIAKWENIVREIERDDGQVMFKITHLSNAGHYVASFENKSPIAVRVMFGQKWDARKSEVVESRCKKLLPGTGGKGIHIAPFISDDYEDDDEVDTYYRGIGKYWSSVEI